MSPAVGDGVLAGQQYGAVGRAMAATSRPLSSCTVGLGWGTCSAVLWTSRTARRRVVPVELQSHGHNRDIDRDFSYGAFGDDIAGLSQPSASGQPTCWVTGSAPAT